jgi:hypothetical protein
VILKELSSSLHEIYSKYFFSGFILRLFFETIFLTLITFIILCWRLNSPFPVIYKLVLSVSKTSSAPCIFSVSTFIYSKNKRDPKTEPCGIPFSTFMHEEK